MSAMYRHKLVHTHIHVHTYSCTCTYTHTYIYRLYTHTYMYTSTYTHILVHIYVHVHTHIYHLSFQYTCTQVKKHVLAILNFTALLIEHSYARHIYNSTEVHHSTITTCIIMICT